MTLEEMLQTLTAEGVENLRAAVELGKWPDGRLLDPEQKALCLQALIAWEQKYVPASQRSGFLPGNDCSGNDSGDNSSNNSSNKKPGETTNDDIQVIREPLK